MRRHPRHEKTNFRFPDWRSAAVHGRFALCRRPARQQSVIHTEYGDIVVTTTLTVYDSAARASTKRANKKHSFTYQGENIATVTLFATFGYDGKSAWVEEASASHDTSGGWSYGSEKIDTDGSTAALSARLTKSSFAPVDFTLSMSCTPSGKIS